MTKKLNGTVLLPALIFYIIIYLIFNLLNAMNWINEISLVSMFIFNFIFFIGASYYKFNRGVHALFVFYGLLFVFQGGLFISYLFTGDFQDISYIELQGANFNLSLNNIIDAANILFLSCLTIFITVLFSKRNFRELDTLLHNRKSNEKLASYFFVLFLIFLPFDLYKKISYLKYIFSHGGYIAIYTGNGEHIQSVGSIIRILSLLSTLSYYFFFIATENKKKLLYITILLFFPLSLLDLILGLRGKFFVFWLVFMLFYKFKFGGTFSIKNILISVFTIAFVSIIIGLFREQQDIIIDNPLAAFFKSQGVSFHVNALAISMKDSFSKYGLNYLIYPMLTVFFHQNSFSHGYLLANDSSIKLNLDAFDNGYATGSSYLAELYLSSNIFGVIVGSFLIGKLLNIINLKNSVFFTTLLFTITINLIYLPRQSFLAPLGDLLKTFPLMLVLYISWLIYKGVINRR